MLKKKGRKDREVTDLNQIFEIVRNCSVAQVGMVENGKPYVKDRAIRWFCISTVPMRGIKWTF